MPAYAAPPGAITSCATRSASIPSAPSETSVLNTLLLPLPMLPVRPITMGLTVISALYFSGR